MKKIHLVILCLLFNNLHYAVGQTIDTSDCFFYDFEKYNSLQGLIYPDSNTYCIELSGVSSSKDLDAFFAAYPFKEKITTININSYSDNIIPSSLKNFRNLSVISVVNCPDLNFRKFFQYLSGMPALTGLILDDNESANIPPNIGSLERLKMLKISNYDYVNGAKLMKNISQLTNLEQLTLSSISKLDMDHEAPLPKNLTNLDLSDNWLSDLPDAIGTTVKINTLDISENNFSDMRELVKKIDSLPLKNLSVTCFSRMDSVFLKKKLKNIDLFIAVYREPDIVYTNKKNSPPQIVPSAITKYYRNIVTPVVGNTKSHVKKYTIDPNREVRLLNSSGTSIYISPNSFTDSLGRIVNDDVDIYYHEFDDVVDIVANGVPMTYDSAGQQYFFRTSGMFEIYAFKDNELLSMAPGKRIVLDFAALDTTSGFNLYRLNENTGNWDFTTPLQNNFKIKKPEYSWAYTRYYDLFKYNFDTLRFAERYYDSTYTRTSKIPAGYFQGKKRMLDKYFKIRRIYRYSKDKDVRKLPNFIMNLKNYSSCAELNAFRGHVWVYSGTLNRKEFAHKFVSRKKWTDTRISYNQGQNLFTIELKSPHETVSMEAFPVKPDYSTDTKEYQKVYHRLDKRYTASLNSIEARFNKSIVRKMLRAQKTIWKKIRAMMSPEEKKMSREEWLDYARLRIAKEKDSLDNYRTSYLTITRSLNIDGFGLWNCDQILRLKNPVNVLAHFKNQYGKEMKAVQVNVIDSRKKGVLSYGGIYGTNRISFDPESETAIFLIDENGSIGLIDNVSVKNAWAGNPNKSDFTFTAYETDPDAITTSEIRKMLGM
ncbi:MAG TPA: leucine-rich repeat domain-containing protein [Bacteroidales bacterium]|nr:leucine-rich repeat domain-containing protein [Bacteroidales bacterium]